MRTACARDARVPVEGGEAEEEATKEANVEGVGDLEDNGEDVGVEAIKRDGKRNAPAFIHEVEVGLGERLEARAAPRWIQEHHTLFGWNKAHRAHLVCVPQLPQRDVARWESVLNVPAERSQLVRLDLQGSESQTDPFSGIPPAIPGPAGHHLAQQCKRVSAHTRRPVDHEPDAKVPRHAQHALRHLCRILRGRHAEHGRLRAAKAPFRPKRLGDNLVLLE